MDPVMLAEKWDEKVDPSGWWMSEKLDGVRGYWNGKAFKSRQGNNFSAPAWFTKDLPTDQHLDGELWCGRGLFQKTLSVVKSQKTSTTDDWKYVTYLVFDAPSVKGTYEERVAWMKENIKKSKTTTYAAPVGVKKCESLKHMKQNLMAVLKKGGEGLMLRKPGSAYERARSKGLLKVKYFHDEECRVTDRLAGTGRLMNCMGKLQCALPNGITFKVGSGFTDVQRRNTKFCPIGSIITFKYQECSDKGTPRFPTFLRARPDLTWEDVIANAKTKRPWSQMKHEKPDFKKQHSILFASIPSRSPSGDKLITTDDEASDEDEEMTTTTTTTTTPAPPGKTLLICKYGSECFRTSADHRGKYQHPQKGATPAPASAVKQPECQFGSNCYRKSDKHRAEFSHPAPAETSPVKIKASEVTDEDYEIMKRGISVGKINVEDYYDLGISDDDVELAVGTPLTEHANDWGVGSGDDEEEAAAPPLKKQRTLG